MSAQLFAYQNNAIYFIGRLDKSMQIETASNKQLDNIKGAKRINNTSSIFLDKFAKEHLN